MFVNEQRANQRGPQRDGRCHEEYLTIIVQLVCQETAEKRSTEATDELTGGHPPERKPQRLFRDGGSNHPDGRRRKSAENSHAGTRGKKLPDVLNQPH